METAGAAASPGVEVRAGLCLLSWARQQPPVVGWVSGRCCTALQRFLLLSFPFLKAAAFAWLPLLSHSCCLPPLGAFSPEGFSVDFIPLKTRRSHQELPRSPMHSKAKPAPTSAVSQQHHPGQNTLLGMGQSWYVRSPAFCAGTVPSCPWEPPAVRLRSTELTQEPQGEFSRWPCQPQDYVLGLKRRFVWVQRPYQPRCRPCRRHR